MAIAVTCTACSGGDGDDLTEADAAATTLAILQESGSPTPRPAASGTTTPGVTPRPAGSPVSGTPAAGLTGRLPDLNSYRYTFHLEGTAGLIAELSNSNLPTGVNPNTGTLVFDVKGSYVKPDRGEATINLSGVNVTRVTIGRQQWTGVGGLVQGPANVSPSEEDYSFIASFWDESPANTLQSFTCNTRETVNGIATRKCTADRAVIERLNQQGDLFSAGFLDLRSFTSGTAEIWVTDNDKVIRFRTDLAGTDSSNRNVVMKMDVDILDINTNITINPPR
jgi:hypothetical protein